MYSVEWVPGLFIRGLGEIVKDNNKTNSETMCWGGGADEKQALLTHI